jgi:membrane-associated HD superfamily phosphohydrolase
MRYLLITADEERMLVTANHRSFGFGAVVRALYSDLGKRHSQAVAAAYTANATLLSLGALAIAAWALVYLVPHLAWAGLVVFLVSLVPAVFGAILIAAALAEAARFLTAGLSKALNSGQRLGCLC